MNYVKDLQDIISNEAVERETKIDALYDYFKTMKFTDMMIFTKAMERITKEFV